MDHIDAALLLQDRQIYGRGFIELVIWKLPATDQEHHHGLKYRLVYIVNGERVLGYDNERGKGDHKHVHGREIPYAFTTVDKFIDDFLADLAEVDNV